MPRKPYSPISYKHIKPHSYFSRDEVAYLATDPQLPHICNLLNDCLDQTVDVTSTIHEDDLPTTPEHYFEINLRYLENFLVLIERLNADKIGAISNNHSFADPSPENKVKKPALEEFDYFKHSQRASYITEQKKNSDLCNYPMYFDKKSYRELPEKLTYEQFWIAQAGDVLDLNKKNVRNAVRNLYYAYYDQKLCEDPMFIPLRDTMDEISDFFERKDIRKTFEVRQRNDIGLS